jgi:hypothetical protein
MWTLKLDENGNVVMNNGKPVFVDENGKDVVFDVNETRNTITRLNGEAQAHRTRAEKAEKDLKVFEGIDPTAARTAIDTVANLDAKKLIDAGQAETVKNEAIKAVNEQYAPIVEENKALKDKIHEMQVGGAFTTSKWIEDNVAVPPDLLQNSFGAHFKENDQGVLIGYYDKACTQQIFSTSSPGAPAKFDEAIEKLIDQYPRKGDILKGTGHSGGGSREGSPDSGMKNPWKEGTINLTEQDRIESKDPVMAGRLKAEAGVA